MPAFRKNKTPIEELYSIKQIFGYKIEPDIEKVGNNYLGNYIHVNMVVSPNIYDQYIEQIIVSLKLSIKFPKLYPQDLPELDISSVNGLSTQDVNEILNIAKDICVKLCGRSMLMDLILRIEDHIKYQIYKNSNEKVYYFMITLERGKD
ncbi:hypothetical protein MXB_4187 [Myxobolus squamalis]|nr:hypothetical protein MXB_4187 [Myxobolus squamalis]